MEAHEKNTPTAAHAFLFDTRADGLPSYYGGFFASAFLRALSAVDPCGTVQSRVLRGDAFVQTLCTRITRVDGGSTGGSWTQGYDMDLYRTVIWDLVDALSEQPNTLDLETLPFALAQSRVYCLVLPTIQTSYGDQIDARLRGTTGYLGAFEIDLGNPVQLTVFIEGLVDNSFIENGTVHLERNHEGIDDTLFEGARDFFPGGERRIPYPQFDESKPPLPSLPPFSERGRASAERYQGKRVFSIEERVIASLVQLQDSGTKDFSFDLQNDRAAILQAELSEAKFVKYLLNPEHKDGASKAKFFLEILGIGPSDWRYLAGQFYAGLCKSDLAELKVKTWNEGFGASFNCVLPIIGRNGRTANVFTNWIMKPGQLPQLSTAIPEETLQPSEGLEAAVPDIVSPLLPEPERFAKLYDLAHAAGVKALESCVPTPMKVEGYPVIMDGMCGSAEVRIPDARRGFARWLVKSGKGAPHFRGGACVFCYHPTQSVDRATAYCNAFASVLQLNGVTCSVSSHLD